ncbi:hypothetical protein [Alistipes sp. ZOR0009]|uniref:WapI family immunity protein n=1 Tax=Alistipes sp. ZOR0009 TaxID=1339253 RepID=UPI00064604BB|nr:hypothetical protein [Alistipes sp. ZOR0009]
MIFKGIDDQSVEFRITNYQYPEIKEGGWDGNWLNVYLKVKSNCGNWQTVDPSLTTWEVQGLIKWFETLSKNERLEHLEKNFTEPNLSFELLDNQNNALKTFRIKFDLESRPESASDDKQYYVDCIADNEELHRIMNDLRIELERYPER